MLPSAITSQATKAGKARDLQPVLTFGKAAGSCSQEGRVYGACILAQSENVEKGMCEREFQMFKECVTAKVSVPQAELQHSITAKRALCTSFTQATDIVV